MSQVSCYVDGFNLYHAIDELGQPKLKWLNLQALAKSFLLPGDTLAGVSCFTAVLTWNSQKSARHRQYIKALRATGVDVIQSKFSRVRKYCKLREQYCGFHEEKQTDVALAVRVLHDVYTGNTDRVVLITADSDHVPLVDQIRTHHPMVKVEVAAPPGRLQQARELCESAEYFTELTPGRLGTCLLPRDVANGAGLVVARCPASYLP